MEKNGANENTPKDDCILRVENVTKVFPGTIALKSVDFNMYRGKVNVLVGENGAGKSTLMKILAGVETKTEGKILLEGKEVDFKNPREAAFHGIGIIYQELNLFPNMNIAENIFISNEITKYHSVIEHKKQEERAAELLKKLEHPLDPKTMVSELKIGEQQIVEIAKSLSQDTKILIMDEPTSALSSSEVEVLFKIIYELKSSGVSIVYISHRLDEVIKIGDYITVLKDGKLVNEALISSIDIPWIVNQMVDKDTVKEFKSTKKIEDKELLKIQSLTLPSKEVGNILEDISFSLRAGEILGIYGLMGAGRTELLESIMGLYPESEFDMWLEKRKVNLKNIKDRIRAGITLIPEDRQRQGLIQCLSVSHNMTLASLWKYVKIFYIQEEKENSRVEGLIRDLSIKVPNAQVLIGSLSGGNQQKVIIGKSLMTNPKVLLMDEPTRGIDVAAKSEVFNIVKSLAEEGLGIIFVSSELKEILLVSDRVIVLSKGRITKTFDQSNINEESLVMASSIGHGISTI
ncbi:MAG: sugar ABC transporter ATP-binding protein [Chitinispirillia bacterium]|jgi:ABC-type sugar transport system ATPase subunit